MAGIKTPLTEILAFIEANTSIKFARVWNNQFEYMEGQEIESFPMPCCFVEVLLPNEYQQLGLGITASDVVWRIHIGANELDAQDGTIEQNVSIFSLRDEIIKELTYKEFSACSGLQKINEEQDYQHTGVYHYIVDFICHFIDDKGDQRQGQITHGPPTTLEVDADIVTEITT